MRRRDANSLGANQHGVFGVWSEKELDLIRKHMDDDESILAKLLPGRTLGAIRTRKTLVKGLDGPDSIVRNAKTKDEAERKLKELAKEKALFLKRGDNLIFLKDEKAVHEMANRGEIYPGDTIYEAYPKYKVKASIVHIE